VYIAPLKALVRERMIDWKVRLEQKLRRKVVELTGDVAPDVRAIAAADVIVTTPEKWDGISRSWHTRRYVQVHLDMYKSRLRCNCRFTSPYFMSKMHIKWSSLCLYAELELPS